MEKQTYAEWLRATLFEKRISQSTLSKALGYAEGVINQKLRRNSFTTTEKYFIRDYLVNPEIVNYEIIEMLNEFKN
jgi:hypothetical protein